MDRENLRSELVDISVYLRWRPFTQMVYESGDMYNSCDKHLLSRQNGCFSAVIRLLVCASDETGGI